MQRDASPSTLKTIFGLLRKDAGLGDEAQRVSQLAWMTFLKVLDERELEKETIDERYRSPIPERFRWRSWAADLEGPRSEALLKFVDSELVPALGRLKGPEDSLAAVVRGVFESHSNRMKSGALLRQAIDKLSEIDFNRLSDRDAFREAFAELPREARGVGELYTPAALAQFVVDMVDPELGETILDPASGAGGFLTAALERVRERWVRTPTHEETLQRSIFGVERQPLGWLLSVTNLLLHGLENPSQIRKDNPLERPLREVGPNDRVDVIVGTLPFGGREDDAVLQNFPAAFRTTETLSLYLLWIMHLLNPGGRAALIVPNSVLFANGVMARIREKLLEECDVHTLVRLPGGVFAPSTNIPTNILFLTRGRPTTELWVYEHPHPEGLKAYARSHPIRAEHFDRARAFWGSREEGELAFKASIEEIKAREYSLDLKNPRAQHTASPQATPAPAPPSPRRTLRPQPTSLRLRELRLRDFRGFERLDLRLPDEGPVVLIGINGAGKSTVLDGIATFLSSFAALASGLDRRHTEIQLGDGDIRTGREVASLGATLFIDGEEQYWELKTNRSRRGAPLARELVRQAEVLRERLRADDAASVPVLCAYSANRGLSEEPEGRKVTYPFRQLQAYDRAFRRGLGPYQDFVRWFRLEEDLENQLRLREDPNHRSPRLEVVREAVKGFLSELGAEKYTELWIERPAGEDIAQGAAKEGALVVGKNGARLRIEQLSEGEKGTILLIADLARRLAVANPGREAPLRGEGIVLIDEIDLHLHPAWQRGFLPGLLKTFPGCQFILSTHSPQALSRVHKENVFVLEDFALVKVTPYTYGRDANSILNEVMGLPERPEDVEHQIRELALLIDEERLDEAKAALGRLAALLGEQDVEVVRLKTLIAFLTD